jgi:hypothetical protein
MTDNAMLSNFAQARCQELIMALWSEGARTSQEIPAEYQAGVCIGKLPAAARKTLPRTIEG